MGGMREKREKGAKLTERSLFWIDVTRNFQVADGELFGRESGVRRTLRRRDICERVDNWRTSKREREREELMLYTVPDMNSTVAAARARMRGPTLSAQRQRDEQRRQEQEADLQQHKQHVIRSV